MSALRWLSGLFLALALVAGAALWLQRQAAADLREEIGLLREEQRELTRLRAENRRLAAAQPSPAELSNLQADRAAVLRLRAEIEKSRDSLLARERALANGASEPGNGSPPAPAIEWRIGVGLDGNLVIAGVAVEMAALRQQLAGLPRGSPFELRVQLPKPENGLGFERVQQSIKDLATVGREVATERGLKMTLVTERATNP